MTQALLPPLTSSRRSPPLGPPTPPHCLCPWVTHMCTQVHWLISPRPPSPASPPRSHSPHPRGSIEGNSWNKMKRVERNVLVAPGTCTVSRSHHVCVVLRRSPLPRVFPALPCPPHPAPQPPPASMSRTRPAGWTEMASDHLRPRGLLLSLGTTFPGPFAPKQVSLAPPRLSNFPPRGGPVGVSITPDGRSGCLSLWLR